MSTAGYNNYRTNPSPRHGCLGCATVLAFLPILTLVIALRLAPSTFRNMLEAYGNKALNSIGIQRGSSVSLSNDDIGYAGSLLPSAQQELYLQLLAGIMERKESFAITNAEPSDIDPVYRAIMRDHPELFWVDGSCKYTYVSIGHIVNVEPGFTVPLEQIESIQQRILAAVAEFEATLPADADEYTIARAAYEFIIDWTDYSRDADQNQNIQSVFLGHASVCAGYARAYQYLLQLHDLECAFVEGSIVDSGEEHAWNLVCIDGQYTYVDPTWGDPTYMDSVDSSVVDATQGIIYDYLCLTTEEIERDRHTFDDANSWPLCTATNLDWYQRTGCMFDRYDDTALSPAFWNAIDSGRAMVGFKFTNDEAFQAASTALAEGTFLRDDLLTRAERRGENSFHYSYSTSEALRIVKVYW